MEKISTTKTGNESTMPNSTATEFDPIPDRDLHTKFVDYGRNAKEWLRKCALLLPEIDRRQIWKKKGFTSISEYAAKLAGMSRSSVEEALRVLRRVEDKPELKKIIERYGIQRVRPVAAIATVETEKFWAEKARNMTKNTLEVYVQNYREETLPRETPQPEKRPDSEGNLSKFDQEGDLTLRDLDEPNTQLKTVRLDLKTDLARRLEYFKKRTDFEGLLEQFLNEIEEREEAEKPAIVENAPRYIHAEMDHYVTNRTGGKCAFPGYDKPIDFLHHAQRYALEKVHDPDRLWGLCRAHNEIAHNGLIENEEGPPNTWRLRREPDRNSWKYHIDQQMATYRKNG